MAVVSLVIHHLSICPILFWQVLDNPNPVIAKTEGCIGWALIPDANMPLFTFISGFLFMHLLGGVVQNIKNLVLSSLTKSRD